MRDLTPIETVYRGVTFRSRLEARWALTLDCADLRWEYEPEGYALSDGTRYLPDFFLPELGCYAEVKPTGDAFLKARAFSREAGQPLLMLAGSPGNVVYLVGGSCGGHGGAPCEMSGDEPEPCSNEVDTPVSPQLFIAAQEVLRGHRFWTPRG